jgi:phage terminase small subunit
MTKPRDLTDAERAALVDPRGLALPVPEKGRDLNPKQLMFASLVAHGYSFKSAVFIAGYTPASDKNARIQGTQLAADPRIAACIESFTAALLKSTAPRALRTMTKIMENPEAKDSDRIKAAGKVLDKVLPTRTAHEVQGHLEHDHRVRVEPAARTLQELYAAAGKTPPPALPAPAQITDAEFEDVTPPGEPDTVSDLAPDDAWTV